MTISPAIALYEGAELLTRALIGLTKKPLAHASGVGEIPPPCWYPIAAGELCSYACPRAVVTLRVRVANCGPTSRLIRSESADGVSMKPPKLTLAPMARGHVTATFKVPADAELGDEYERLVWIRGCQSHFVRWRIVTSVKDVDLHHELKVEDRPDPIHHWYDHFYCSHPCLAQGGGVAAKP
jgi:hypothetical protein